MKSPELIKLLEKCDPTLDVVVLGGHCCGQAGSGEDRLYQIEVEVAHMEEMREVDEQTPESSLCIKLMPDE